MPPYQYRPAEPSDAGLSAAKVPSQRSVSPSTTAYGSERENTISRSAAGMSSALAVCR